MDQWPENHTEPILGETRLPENRNFPACPPSDRCTDTPNAPAKVVLLIEDEASVADTQQQMVERIGWQVLIAACGQEALAYLHEKNRKICMVLMDMDLPDIHGSQLFKKIRSIRPGLKVVVCSGDTRADDVQELVAGGAHGCLQKPFGIKQLQMALSDGVPLETESA